MSLKYKSKKSKLAELNQIPPKVVGIILLILHKQALLIYIAFELLDYKGSGLTQERRAEIITTHL